MINATDAGSVSEVTIGPQTLFIGPGGVPAFVGLEYMAQAVTAYGGYKSYLAGEPIAVGFVWAPQGSDPCQFFACRQTSDPGDPPYGVRMSSCSFTARSRMPLQGRSFSRPNSISPNPDPRESWSPPDRPMSKRVLVWGGSSRYWSRHRDGAVCPRL